MPTRHPSATHPERRRLPRFEVAIWAEEAVDEGVYYHLITNLSRSGFFIEKQLPFPPGAEVEVRFQVPDAGQSVVLRGEVVDNYRTDDDHLRGAGIRFLDPDRETLRQIDRCIRYFHVDDNRSDP